MSLTITDLFCGAGGSGLGAHAAGFDLIIAANHWDRAIETHAANFPNTEHDCADISQVDPRRYPATDVLWASPECTNHSQAKGRKRSLQSQPDLFGETLPDAAADRSRATMWDVPRFAERMLLRGRPYRAIVVENVVDAAKWIMWSAWLQAMTALGYEHQTVWLNSMHAPAIAAPRAPQSRDRLYVVFWRTGQRAPQLEPRPLAWCVECSTEVAAVQSWKKRTRWGRYRAQYVYRCPNSTCRHAIVEPYALPAAAAIDWTLPGTRIGDRDKPLAAKTLARIEAGIERYWRPVHLEAGGNQYDTEPLRTLHTSETKAVATPPLMVPVEGRDGKAATPTSQPVRTMTTRSETALVVPYHGTAGAARPAAVPVGTLTTHDRYGLAMIAELRGGGSSARPVSSPLATVTAGGNNHMLVRHLLMRNNTGGAEMITPIEGPARTITTGGHQSLLAAHSFHVDDCTFRMLEPTEIQAAMAFHDTYRVLGTRRERVKQLGNGVTPPAAEWLLRAVAASLAA